MKNVLKLHIGQTHIVYVGLNWLDFWL